MALVVLLRGVNIGGHRTFRPSLLARELRHLDCVNIGAAGTFVIRGPVGRLQLRAEIARRLPFITEVVICDGRDIVRLMAGDALAGMRMPPHTVRFLSVLSRRPRLAPTLPLTLPARGPWLLKVVARDGRFVHGLYRPDMKVIGYLGALDKRFGVPMTSRGWSTIEKVAKIVAGERGAKDLSTPKSRPVRSGRRRAR